MYRSFILALISVGTLCGCSSVSSVSDARKASNRDGLIYYMPEKDILISITKSQDDALSATVSAGDAYPDLSVPYILQFNTNLVGKNVINVTVKENGLLSSTKSVTTAGIGQALVNLAETAGAAAGLAAAPPPAAGKKCSRGTQTYLVTAKTGETGELCDGITFAVNLAIADPFASGSPLTLGKKHGYQDGENVSGVFYRQPLPYKVTLSSKSGDFPDQRAIVFSPSGASVGFLPVKKTLFANNEADLGFADGVPTKWDQTTDGELVALFKIPADILSAYFAAVGRIFDAFKARDEKDASAMDASTKLELAKLKAKACKDAIAVNDTATIDQLECGK